MIIVRNGMSKMTAQLSLNDLVKNVSTVHDDDTALLESSYLRTYIAFLMEVGSVTALIQDQRCHAADLGTENYPLPLPRRRTPSVPQGGLFDADSLCTVNKVDLHLAQQKTTKFLNNSPALR